MEKKKNNNLNRSFFQLFVIIILSMIIFPMNVNADSVAASSSSVIVNGVEHKSSMYVINGKEVSEGEYNSYISKNAKRYKPQAPNYLPKGTCQPQPECEDYNQPMDDYDKYKRKDNDQYTNPDHHQKKSK